MANRSITLTDPLYAYVLETSLREPDLLRRLREETARMPLAGMQIGPEQGQFMALLAQAIGARRYLEIGTFTGYSALAVALAMPPDAHLVCCDISAEYTAVARRYWAAAGVDARIELRLAPAVETLRALAARPDTFDLAFIDADKENYEAYYEGVLPLVRRGGLILIDNVLWSGKVADPKIDDPDTTALRRLNAKLKDDNRIAVSMLPIGDGLTLALKR